MKYIYTRVSTDKQDTQNQLHSLTQRYPDATVVEETASGAKQRPELDALLERLQSGDTLIVAALDRLGRRLLETVGLIESLHKRDITLISVREGLDYSTISGKVVAQILCAVAEMERNLISARTKACVSRRRSQGLSWGNDTYSTETVAKVFELRSQGQVYTQIAKATGMSRGRVCQIIRSKRCQ